MLSSIPVKASVATGISNQSNSCLLPPHCGPAAKRLRKEPSHTNGQHADESLQGSQHKFDYQILPQSGFSPEIRMMKSEGNGNSHGGLFQRQQNGLHFYSVPSTSSINGSTMNVDASREDACMANERNGSSTTKEGNQSHQKRFSTGYRYDDILFAPYNYLLQTPGKGIRPALLDAFNEWLHVPEDRINIIKTVVEMLHGGSLLIDDIEDGSELRRGVPTAHKIYGDAQTINSANYVYFAALQLVMKLRLDNGEPGPGVQIFTAELLNAHRGQGLEIFWRENCICPTEEQYLEMVANKTACLLRLGIALMVGYRGPAASVTDSPIVGSCGSSDLRRNISSISLERDGFDLKETEATNGKAEGQSSSPRMKQPPDVIAVDDDRPLLPEDYIDLCTILGSFFQIRDDYINLRSTRFAKTKGFCEDLTEGKFSFPVIHHLHHAPNLDERQQLLNILRQRTNDENLKNYALRLMESSGSFAYTRSYLQQIDAKAMGMIHRIAKRSVKGNDKLESIVALLRRDFMEES